MSQLTLRFSVVEKNDRGQEVELVRKALQFKPQVIYIYFSVSPSSQLMELGPLPNCDI